MSPSHALLPHPPSHSLDLLYISSTPSTNFIYIYYFLHSLSIPFSLTHHHFPHLLKQSPCEYSEVACFLCVVCKRYSTRHPVRLLEILPKNHIHFISQWPLVCKWKKKLSLLRKSIFLSRLGRKSGSFQFS